MRLKTLAAVCLVLVGVLAIASVAAAEVVVVSAEETWDGKAMHGITPTGSGADGDPFTYTFPDGLKIESGGAIVFDPDPSDKPGDELTRAPAVAFVFGNGGLEIASGGKIDVAYGGRGDDPLTFSIELGANSITGEGEIVNGQADKKSSPMNVVITSKAGGNIKLKAIKINRKDADEADVSIEAGGAVEIGEIDVSDSADDGNDSGTITISATSIKIGDLDASSAWSSEDPESEAKGAGEVTLTALGSPGFDSGMANDNDLANSVTITGTLKTKSSSTKVTGGDVTIVAVKVTLAEGSKVDLNTDATLTIEAGVAGAGASEAQLFENKSGSDQKAQHTVKWKGGAAEAKPAAEGQ